MIDLATLIQPFISIMAIYKDLQEFTFQVISLILPGFILKHTRRDPSLSGYFPKIYYEINLSLCNLKNSNNIYIIFELK